MHFRSQIDAGLPITPPGVPSLGPIEDLLNDVLDLIKPILSGLSGSLNSQLKSLLSSVLRLSDILKVVTNVSSVIGSILQSTLNRLLGCWIDAVKLLIKLVCDLLRRIEKILKKDLSHVKHLEDRLVDVVENTLKDAGKCILSLTHTLTAAVNKAAYDASSAVQKTDTSATNSGSLASVKSLLGAVNLGNIVKGVSIFYPQMEYHAEIKSNRTYSPFARSPIY